ncbi:MAG: phosphate/phosphite/phosphonate ABC transporter substrate-binding protein [Myxococcales bacterium]|nr:phosphate/phosphite/phosphonate ABC transporter substrate-binding protein [Myxococcales bacterium]MDP3501776.1 phosphate/phosphite/phosphonate ABC transporter substrate-binding protein [Myxococcales bacterium]
MRGLALGLLVLASCAQPIAPAPVRPRQAPVRQSIFAAPAGFTRLRMLVPPVLERESLEKSYAKLVDYLSRQLGVPVELVIGESYEDVVAKTAAGDFDVVMLSPYTYALAHEQRPLPCLVQMIGDGSATSAGYIVVREDSPIRSVADLPGARFGFVDRASTSGYIYAVKAMLDQGIDPKKHLGPIEFLGNHEAVLLAVLEGRIDAGATYQGSLVSLKRSKDIDPLSFRIIAKTERTPRDILCARPELPEVVRTEIQRLLMVLTVRDRVGRELLSPMSVNGFQPPDDAAYDGVRKVAAEVGAWDAKP